MTRRRDGNGATRAPRGLAAATVATAAWLAAACSDPAPSASDEVAGELRALRRQLAATAQQQQRVADERAPAAPAAGGVSAGTAQEALAPLRAVLDELARNQKDLAARQVALTQELQRWSQLLVDSVAGARTDEAKALAARLQQLEQSLQQQDARHREVETLMQGALERTADRLDQFLQRLPGTPAPASTPPGTGSGTGTGAGNDTGSSPSRGTGNDTDNGTGSTSPNRDDAGARATPAAERAGTGSGASPGDAPAPPSGGDDERPLGNRSGRAAARWWWLALTTMACGVAGLFLRRAWRLPTTARRTAPVQHGHEPEALAFHVGAPPGAERDAPHDAREPREQTAEELWAAAALLGEAVDRLRQQHARSPAAATAAAHDDLFVLTDDGTAFESAEPAQSDPIAEPSAARNPVPTTEPNPAEPPDRAPRVAAEPGHLPFERPIERTAEPTFEPTVERTTERTIARTAERTVEIPRPPAPATARNVAAPTLPSSDTTTPPDATPNAAQRNVAPDRPQWLATALPHTAAAAAALACLARQPLVLRKPAPRIVERAGGVMVEYAVLPGAPPAEHTRLAWAVRDAITRAP